MTDMKMSRFAKEQIIDSDGHTDQGAVPQRRLQQRHGYKWRAKFDGMQVSEALRLRELEFENARLKRRLAEGLLDMHALKNALRVKCNGCLTRAGNFYI
jgi:putative transposase